MDLDGTVRFNPDDGSFVRSKDKIALYPGVEEKLWEYRERWYIIIGITNQGGVALGFKTEQDVKDEIEATRALFEDDPFTEILYCPTYPYGRNEEYVVPDDRRRKPNVGMIEDAARLIFSSGLGIDWRRSLVVGDRPEDEQLAANCSLRFVYANEFFGRDIA